MNLKPLLILCSVLLLTSCSAFISQHSNKNTVSSSLMDFLYPDEQSRKNHQPELPVLTLPVKVGIAFVPTKYGRNNGVSQRDQIALLEKVKTTFSKYEYIDNIEIIPDTYLKGGEGFSTLAQVSRLYDVDVIALVSYDQVKQSYENNAALLYWTIVGMYVIPGNENTVQTFVDTAVFDVKSQKMLFRAPGISKLEERSTALRINETMAEQSLAGFSAAVEDMNTNLEAELARFKTRVKEEKIATIKHREGYSGGSLPWWLTLLLAGVATMRFAFSKQK